MAKQAKCTVCKVRWTWKKDKPLTIEHQDGTLSYLKCPTCFGPLEQTSHLCMFSIKSAGKFPGHWVPATYNSETLKRRVTIPE
jgi:hypothetical protein